MKLCLIPPKAMLSLAKGRPCHFLLADRVLDDPEYAEFYRKETGFKIMDNGAFELGTPMELDQIFKAAELAQVQEIVVFDHPLKPKKTIQAIRHFFSILSPEEHRMYDYMVVPHGRNLFEWIENLKTIREKFRGDFETVGFSIIDLWKHEQIRPYAVGWVNHCTNVGFNFHLLGLDDPRELFCYGLRIRSCDTSLPFSVAYNMNVLSPYSPAPEHQRVEYNSYPTNPVMDPVMFNLAESNIEILDKSCGN